MSKKENTVKITETELVDLIDKIVTEAVAEKKTEWIAEQEAKGASLLESKIAKLEKTIQSITEGKK